MKRPRSYDLGIVRLADLKNALGEPIRDQYMPDRETARVIFVDEIPDANWAHACEYRIMDGDRLLVTLERTLPPHESFDMTEIYLSDKELWNPRFVEWCRSIGVRPQKMTRRRPDDEIRRVNKLPWTIVFSQWLMSCWDEWAKALGYKRSRDGFYSPHEVALASGHTHDAFDRWLVMKVDAMLIAGIVDPHGRTIVESSGYRYTLSSARESSAKFGPCKVCGQHASEMFQQAEEKRIQNPPELLMGPTSWSETGRLWGHRECLEKARK